MKPTAYVERDAGRWVAWDIAGATLAKSPALEPLVVDMEGAGWRVVVLPVVRH